MTTDTIRSGNGGSAPVARTSRARSSGAAATIRDLVLLLAGVGLAAFGLVSALRPAAPPEATVTSAPPTTAVVQEIVEVPLDASVTVEGLPSSVASVLSTNGYAGLVTEAALSETLPPSVVRVLIDANVTLTVADRSGS